MVSRSRMVTARSLRALSVSNRGDCSPFSMRTRVARLTPAALMQPFEGNGREALSPLARLR